MTTMGERIKYLRGIKGITQEILANEIKCDRSSLSKWENGLTFPPAEVVLELAKDHIDYPLIFVDSYTGLRQSEILGLTWEKILWDKLIICVIQALHKTYEEEVEVKENEIEEGFELRPRTKNETSTREIDV